MCWWLVVSGTSEVEKVRDSSWPESTTVKASSRSGLFTGDKSLKVAEEQIQTRLHTVAAKCSRRAFWLHFRLTFSFKQLRVSETKAQVLNHYDSKCIKSPESPK